MAANCGDRWAGRIFLGCARVIFPGERPRAPELRLVIVTALAGMLATYLVEIRTRIRSSRYYEPASAFVIHYPAYRGNYIPAHVLSTMGLFKISLLVEGTDIHRLYIILKK
jgi:hypothetical protein